MEIGRSHEDIANRFDVVVPEQGPADFVRIGSYAARLRKLKTEHAGVFAGVLETRLRIGFAAQ